MNAVRTCPRCHTLNPDLAKFCSRCGKRLGWGGKVATPGALGAAVLAVLIAVGWIFHARSPGPAEPADPHVDSTLLSGEDRPALQIPGILSMTYRDLGNRVQLTITAKANPVLLIDVNQNHAVDKEDVSFTALPGDRVCVTRVIEAESATCSSLGTSVRVRSARNGEATTSTWSIPKIELGRSRTSADLVLQTFHPYTQTGEFYPAAPFGKVYRLAFLSAPEGPPISSPVRHSEAAPSVPPRQALEQPMASAEANLAKPRPATFAPPQIAEFEALYDAAGSGAPLRLRWATTGALSVDIEPGVGLVAATGERAIDASKATEYVLQAKGEGGSVTRAVTVSVVTAPAPVIADFSADETTLRPGGTTTLRWSVGGQVSRVSIDPVYSGLPSQGARPVTVSGTTEYTLTAIGPGGAVKSKLTLHTAPAPAAAAVPVTVPVPPPLINLQASATVVQPGEAVLLRWNVANADDVSVSPSIGRTDPVGRQTLHPTATVRYTVTANGPGGSASRGITISVARPGGAP